MKRHPALDGVRALAVVAVLLFHADVPWAGGGFLGVDVFFVLSGYLITAILLEEHEVAGRVDVVAFWARRARRLLPALCLLIGAVGVALALTGSDPSRFRMDAISALGYFANWHYLQQATDYFASAGDSFLQHTWTLAIEEQFYLVWPVVVAVAARARRHRRAVLLIALAGAAASAVQMLILSFGSVDASRMYFGTDTRVQSLLVGAALAVSVPRVTFRRFDSYVARTIAAAVGVVGSIGLVALWWRVDADSGLLYRGGFLLTAIATAAVITSVVIAPDGTLSRALGAGPLRGLGRISYGVYLWHWPIQIAVTNELTGLRGAALFGLRVLLTLAAASVSFFLLEHPIRIRVVRPVLSLQGVAASVIALAAVIALFPRGPEVGVASLTGAVAVFPPTPEPARSPVPQAGATPMRSAMPRPAPVAVAPPSPTYTVAVVGDSVAQSLADGLAPWGPAHGLRVLNDATLGCGVARSGDYRLAGRTYGLAQVCGKWPETWGSYLSRDDPDVVAIIVGRHEVLDRVHEGSWTNIGHAGFDAYVTAELNRAVDVATAHGSRVALFTAPYYRTRERPDGGQWPENDPGRVDAFNHLARSVAERHPDRATVIELGPRTGPNGGYAAYVDGVRVRADGVHFSREGSAWLAPWLLPQLRQIAARGRVAPPTPVETISSTPDPTPTVTAASPSPEAEGTNVGAP